MNPENYRPIALVNTVTKLFTQILYDRLFNWNKVFKVIPEFQSGFRAGRGCADNIFVLNSMIQYQLQKTRGKIFTLFVDFRKAFPSVNHNILWKKLLNKGLSPKFVKIFISLYSKAQMNVKLGEEISPPVEVTEGVLQGEVLSPFLFALFLSDLLEFLESRGIRGVSVDSKEEITLLAYADDLIYFSNTAPGMQRILNALLEYCSINCLTLNPTKSKIVIFKKGGAVNAKMKFKYGTENIEVVNEYIYLGTIFSIRGLFEKAAKSFSAKATLASISTISLIKTIKYNMQWNKINLLFDSLISSVIMHSSAIWGPKHLDSIEKIQCQFFKKLLCLLFYLNVPQTMLSE